MKDTREPKTPTSPFTHKKSLGQNFLTSNVVPRWLCAAAALVPGETVLEIGPGTGALTKELLAQGVRVIAVEADIRAVDYLKEAFSEALEAGILKLFHADARELNPADFGLRDHAYTVVANIPYYLSGFLLRRLLESDVQPKTLVFLMQKELVERIARAKKSSLLSLSVAAFGHPQYVKTVTRGHFNPPPKVDSAILAIRDISRERLAGLDVRFFFDLLHRGLGSKRKQLVANLSQTFDRTTVLSALTSLSLSPTVRGEDLGLDDWINLATLLKKH